MRFYKAVDFYLQCLLLFGTIISICFIRPEIVDGSWFMLFYAGTQIISLLVNGLIGVAPWKMRKWRRVHQWGMMIVFVLIALAFLQGSMIGSTGDKDDKYRMNGLGTLIFAAIPAAISTLFYTVITGKEWVNIRAIKRKL